MDDDGRWSAAVGEFVRKEVTDWDNETISTARFKAFSGQRSDWQPKFVFWRDLILKVARHFGLFIINPSQVKNNWFDRGGLTPLCIDHVLSLMYTEGDLVQRGDLVDPTSGRLSQLFRTMKQLMLKPTAPQNFQDHVILLTLLKDKADEIIKILSESHWTSSCIITMRKFENICGGSNEASAILSYLSGCGRARYLSISKTEFIEGVKVTLLTAAVSSITSLDYDNLHLIWTAEKLQQQLDVIDQRYEKSRKSALASLKSGNKKVALRHARELKLNSESREKCTSLLNRVDGVLNVIADAESNKKVSEAIQIGAQAIKENRISVEEVQLCLQELDESFDLQKQVESALESTLTYSGIEDEDIDEELKKLELEVTTEKHEVSMPKSRVDSAAEETAATESTEALLSDALSNLRIVDEATEEFVTGDSVVPMRNNRSRVNLEAA